MNENITLLLKAINFSVLAHNHQTRKDGKTPYIVHPLRIMAILQNMLAVNDLKILIASLLHDVIEDTNYDFDDIASEFGRDIADWVRILSKDKRLPYNLREKEYCLQLKQACWQVKLIKLVDVYDNIISSGYTKKQREKIYKKKYKYIKACSCSDNILIKKVINAIEKIVLN